MTDKIALMMEAERRGLLPPEKVALLAEAKRRGLVSAPSQSQAPMEAPGYWQQRGSELKSLGEGLRHNIAETALGVGQLVGAAGEDDVQAFRQRKAEAQAQAAAGSPRGADFFSGGDVLGTVATTAAPAARMGALTGLRGLGVASAGGGVYGATRPVMGDESRVRNTAIGAGAGATGQLAGSALATMGRVAPQAVRNTFRAAQDRGVKLTGAQVSDSEFVKRLAHLSDKLPLSGATKRTAAQVQAVNRELAKEIGSVVDDGGKVRALVNDDGVIDAGVMAQRYAKFDDEFDRVFAEGMPLDRQFLATLADVRRQALEGMDETAQRAIDTVIKRLRAQAQDGKLNGQALQSLDRFLRKSATGGGDRQTVATELREALHDTYGRTASPTARAQWDKLRKEYSIYKRLEPLVARNPDGPIPPTQLTGALNADKMGKARMARGEAGELGALAGIGRRMRGPQTSGSPEGAQTAAVGYGMMANPVSTLALLLSGNTAGRVINSNALARLLMSEGRGQIAPLAPYARPLPLMLSGPAYADEPERP